MNQEPHPFGRKDVVEIAIGAAVLSLPIALGEEVWDLGAELPLLNTVLIALGSYILVGLFVYFRMYHGNLEGHRRVFVRRVGTVYLITLLTATLCLAAFGKTPFLTEPLVALKRIIIVSLPASFSATVVDSLS